MRHSKSVGLKELSHSMYRLLANLLISLPLSAAWRIFQFPLHQHSPAVVRLQLHLPNQQMINFNPDEENRDQNLLRPDIDKTNLTEIFAAFQKHPEARSLTYPNMLTKFVWNNHKKEWWLRKRGGAVGRVYFAGPAAGERYYLRMLLYIVKGPISWEELRRIDEVVYDTFKGACAARGFLETDEEFEQCLEEAGLMQTGRKLRRLFAIILLECAPVNPLLLWNKHFQNFCDDCRYRLLEKNIDNPSLEQISSFGLHDSQILQRSGKTLGDFGLPSPTHSFEDQHSNIQRIIVEERSYYEQSLNEM